MAGTMLDPGAASSAWVGHPGFRTLVFHDLNVFVNLTLFCIKVAAAKRNLLYCPRKATNLSYLHQSLFL